MSSGGNGIEMPDAPPPLLNRMSVMEVGQLPIPENVDWSDDVLRDDDDSDVEEEVEEVAVELTTFEMAREVANAVLSDISYRRFVFFEAILLVFASDVHYGLTSSRYTDTLYGVLFIGILFSWVIDFLLRITFVKTYSWDTVFFWHDVLIMVTLVFDIPWTSNAIFGINVLSNDFTTTIDSAKTMASGTTWAALRLMRALRSFRLVKLFEVFSQYARDFEWWTAMFGYIQKRYGMKTISEYLEQQKHTETGKTLKRLSDEVKREATLGSVISLRSARYMTIMLTVMYSVLPFLFIDNYDLAQERMLNDLITQASQPASVYKKNGGSYDWDESIKWTQNFAQTGLFVPVPFLYYNIKGKTLDVEWKDPNFTNWRPEDIKVVVNSKYSSMAAYNIKDINQGLYAYAIVLNWILLILLFLGSFMFHCQAHFLLLEPIQRMLIFVKRLQEDPLAVQTQEERDADSELEINSLFGLNEENEAGKLEKTFQTLASLLQIGMGAAGAHVIKKCMGQKGKISAVIPGTKIVGLYAFCDIRRFTDATECLREDCTGYVNNIADIVHREADQALGCPNKNVGDAFLVVWRGEDLFWQELPMFYNNFRDQKKMGPIPQYVVGNTVAAAASPMTITFAPGDDSHVAAQVAAMQKENERLKTQLQQHQARMKEDMTRAEQLVAAEKQRAAEAIKDAQAQAQQAQSRAIALLNPGSPRAIAVGSVGALAAAGSTTTKTQSGLVIVSPPAGNVGSWWERRQQKVLEIEDLLKERNKLIDELEAEDARVRNAAKNPTSPTAGGASSPAAPSPPITAAAGGGSFVSTSFPSSASSSSSVLSPASAVSPSSGTRRLPGAGAAGIPASPKGRSRNIVGVVAPPVVGVSSWLTGGLTSPRARAVNSPQSSSPGYADIHGSEAAPTSPNAANRRITSPSASSYSNSATTPASRQQRLADAQREADNLVRQQQALQQGFDADGQGGASNTPGWIAYRRQLQNQLSSSGKNISAASASSLLAKNGTAPAGYDLPPPPPPPPSAPAPDETKEREPSRSEKRIVEEVAGKKEKVKKSQAQLHMESMTRMADNALACVIRVVVEVFGSRDVQKFCSHPRIQAVYGDSFEIKLGFGLHCGWGIEGPIGSSHKIDASYLSPHVNLSEHLEATTKQYGAKLLMSGEFYCLLSPNLARMCRKVDCVEVSGKSEPLELYTFDITDNDIKNLLETTLSKHKKHRSPKEAKEWTERLETYDENGGKLAESAGAARRRDPAGVGLFVRGQSFKVLQNSINKDFFPLQKRAVKAYLAGDWLNARTLFQSAAACYNDEATKDVMKFMESHNFVAPSSWAGYRPEE